MMIVPSQSKVVISGYSSKGTNVERETQKDDLCTIPFFNPVMCTCIILLFCSCLFSSFFLCPSSCACSIVSHQLNNSFSFVSRPPKMRLDLALRALYSSLEPRFFVPDFVLQFDQWLKCVCMHVYVCAHVCAVCAACACTCVHVCTAILFSD